MVPTSVTNEVYLEVVHWLFLMAFTAYRLILTDDVSFLCITCPGLGLIIDLDFVREMCCIFGE